MITKILSFIQKHNLITADDRLIVGVSGGADSVCLLHVLSILQKKIPFSIYVVHVHHGLRLQADDDEAFIVSLCLELEVPYEVIHASALQEAKNQKISVEEAGRNVRRLAFETAMKRHEGTKIVLAHHRNDNVETVLMNLMRGAGISGLSGIKALAGDYIRPLLVVDRLEIESWLQSRNFGYRTDETNSENVYTRNCLRNQIIPLMEAHVNSQAVLHVDRAAHRLREVDDFLNKQTEAAWKKMIPDATKSKGGIYIPDETKAEESIYIPDELYHDLHPALQKNIIKKALITLSKKSKNIDQEHILAVWRLFENQVGKRVDLPYGMKAFREYHGVRLQCNVPEMNSSSVQTNASDTQVVGRQGVAPYPIPPFEITFTKESVT